MISAISTVMYLFEMIVSTMRRERYVTVTEEGEMELGELEDFDVNDDMDLDLSPLPKSNNLVKTTPLETAVVFDSSEKLRQYVNLTHKTGVLLFGLFMGMDFSHMWITYMFCVGFSCRWMMSWLVARDSMCDVLWKIWIMIFIIASYVWLASLMEIPFPSMKTYPVTAPLFMIGMFVAGFEWAKTAPYPVCQRSITELCLDSRMTLLFLSLPVFIILYRSNVMDGQPHISFKNTLFIWLLQPSVKFLCVIILVLSIRARRIFEIVFVLTTTLVFQACFTKDLNIISLSLMSLLIVGYIFRVIAVINYDASSEEHNAKSADHPSSHSKQRGQTQGQ